MSLKIYSAEDIRSWDEFTIKNEPIQSIELMERAATNWTKYLLASHPFDHAAIFCGIGNNGGDGLVIARLLHERGLQCTVYLVNFSDRRSSDNQTNLDRLPKSIPVISIETGQDIPAVNADLIIDAILGTGLNKSVDGWLGSLIDQINLRNLPIVSVDIPSGLMPEDNRSNDLKHVIKATLTLTFQSPKLAFLLSKYAGYCGHFKIIPIGLSEQFVKAPIAEFIIRSDIRLKNRLAFSHKGNHGYALIIAGFDTMAGACALSVKAAYRAGCGYVGFYTSQPNRDFILHHIPEALFVNTIFSGLPEKTKSIGIGPGLGQDELALNSLKRVLDENVPTVIDADAINLLSSHRNLLAHLKPGTILTPHLGELEKLLGKFDSPEDLLEKQVSFSKQYQVFIIQKGAYSKITNPEGKVFINSSGNAGMASAGMGDVLTGIITSLLAQGYSAEQASIQGTFLHGYAADLVKRKYGERGMLASDVIAEIPHAINSF